MTFHHPITAETSQQRADRLLKADQDRRRRNWFRNNAIEQDLYIEGVAHCCDGCDKVLPTEGAWCSDCESVGSYAVVPEREDAA